MTHMKPMSELEGTFTPPSPPKYDCRKCKATESVIAEGWDSSCGGYEDTKYTCTKCGHYWWVDGPDS